MSYRDWIDWQKQMAIHDAERKRRKALGLAPFNANT